MNIALSLSLSIHTQIECCKPKIADPINARIEMQNAHEQHTNTSALNQCMQKDSLSNGKRLVRIIVSYRITFYALILNASWN